MYYRCVPCDIFFSGRFNVKQHSKLRIGLHNVGKEMLILKHIHMYLAMCAEI